MSTISNRPLRVAFIGSRKYEGKRKIKDMVFKLKQKYGDEVEIVSGGQQKGADGFAKKAALEFNMKYVEFPPAHYQWNQHCIKDPTNYGKVYRVWYFFDRNKEVADYSDIGLFFIPNGIITGGSADTYKHFTKLDKKVLIFN